jgi:hypothetical protein
MQAYEEVQNSPPVWAAAIVVLVALYGWVTFLSTVLFGVGGPTWLGWLLLITVGVLLPLFFYVNKLVITVSDDGVRVRYVPISNRLYTFDEIARAEAKQYNPLMEYGGWGVRIRSGKRAWSMRGNRGVELTLKNGDIIMLGSQDPEPLERAIKARL